MGGDAGPGTDAAVRDTGVIGVDSGPGMDGGPDDSGVTSPQCTNDMPCTGGGICAGSGCSMPWQCIFSGIACTDDESPFCGCDGATFYGSSTCPLEPFAFRGECDAVRDCDPNSAACDAPPPTCDLGFLPEVVAGCWGDCVPIGLCGCTTDEDCPGALYNCEGVSAGAPGRCAFIKI